MKSGGHDIPLSSPMQRALSLCQDFDSRTDLYNAGSTNEHHLKRAAGQRSLGMQNGRNRSGVRRHCVQPRHRGRPRLRCGRMAAPREQGGLLPAQVPKTGGSCNSLVGNQGIDTLQRNLSMVVDSPPGRTSPSRLDSCAGLRISTGSAPVSESASACAA